MINKKILVPLLIFFLLFSVIALGTPNFVDIGTTTEFKGDAGVPADSAWYIGEHRLDMGILSGWTFTHLEDQLFFGELSGTDFIDLYDTPISYTGEAGKFIKVNATEDALEYGVPAGAGDMLKATYDIDEDSDIDVAAGGTEKSSWTLYAIPYLSGTTAFGEILIGTAEYALTVNAGGTGYDWTLFDLSLYYLKTELDTFSELQSLVADKTLVNEEDVFTIDADWVNTANPWADDEVANDITIDLATLATTFTVTDNEDEALACLLVFVDGATGAQGAETDGDLHYNPSTGVLTSTAFTGNLLGNVTGDLTGEASTVCGFTPAGGSLTLAGDDALTLTTTAATNVTLPTTGTLMANLEEDTDPDLGGELDAGAHSIGFTIQTATGDGGTTIDWKLGNYFLFTHGNMAETFTFTAPTNPGHLTLIVVEDANGGHDCTWPEPVTWLGDEPTWTDGGVEKGMVVAIVYDGTTYWCQGTPWEE